MAVIAWPDGVNIRAIEWVLDRPAQINRSDYTGARRVTANPWHGKWSAKLEIAPIVGEQNIWKFKAFLAALRGPVNTFRLPATYGAQSGLPAATVTTTAAKGAVTMSLTGVQMQAGQMATVNDQLLQIISVADAAITFEPPLRAQATSGTAVEVGNPTCLVSLVDSAVALSAEPGVIYSAAFDVEEVF